MSALTAATRSVAFFAWMLVIVMILGKHQVGQLTLSDYITGLAIGTIAGSTAVTSNSRRSSPGIRPLLSARAR